MNAPSQAEERGSPHDVSTLYATYRAPIERYIRTLIRNSHDVEDLTQDVFLRAACALGRMGPDLHVRAWLYRIARNRCLDFLRRQRVLHFFSLEAPGQRFLPGQTTLCELSWEEMLPDDREESDPEHVVLARDALVRTKEALDELPPRAREIIELRVFQSRSCAEIAQVVGGTEGAVKSVLSRARRKVRHRVLSGEAKARRRGRKEERQSCTPT